MEERKKRVVILRGESCQLLLSLESTLTKKEKEVGRHPPVKATVRSRTQWEWSEGRIPSMEGGREGMKEMVESKGEDMQG